MTDPDRARPHCDVRPQTLPVLAPELPRDRTRAIIRGRSKWQNGTVLRYVFLGGPEDQRAAVRAAFATWKALGIGLGFLEVADRSEAEVRIAFDRADGSWSYVGRDVLTVGAAEPTMNFGWDVTSPYGRTTALHEIGHTLGMPHEHQNPFAGIEWDEPAVYRYFAGPPNGWSREQTFHNVLRKLSTSEVEGSGWDPESIMEYWFPPGLIVRPEAYRDGIDPPGTISARDREYALRWYPPLGPAPLPALTPFRSVPLALAEAGQADFVIVPPASRAYEIATFGEADTVLVLFEEVDGELRFLRGDDDSGEQRNARFRLKLFQGRRYVLRVRLVWAGRPGMTGVMLW